MPASTASLHDTYYVVAHFHYVLSLGAVFAIFAGWYYWFPKMTGYMYNETHRQAALLADLHRRQPGLLPAALPRPAGMPRRYVDYPDAFAGWNYVSSIGSYISGVGVLIFLYGVIAGLRAQEAGGGQSVGRGRDDAGMDAVVAAAVPPVRDAAARSSDRGAASRPCPTALG